MKSLKKIRAEINKLTMAETKLTNLDAFSREMSKLELAMLERQQRPRWKLLKASKKTIALPSKKGKRGK